jgi:hypothetical protein
MKEMIVRKKEKDGRLNRRHRHLEKAAVSTTAAFLLNKELWMDQTADGEV